MLISAAVRRPRSCRQAPDGLLSTFVSPPLPWLRGRSPSPREHLRRVDVTTPAMNVEVTSVSKQESTVGRSPAAIYVITSEMIKRSGFTKISDVLRMVPSWSPRPQRTVPVAPPEESSDAKIWSIA